MNGGGGQVLETRVWSKIFVFVIILGARQLRQCAERVCVINGNHNLKFNTLIRTHTHTHRIDVNGWQVATK